VTEGLARRVAAVVQGGIQGERIPGIPAEDLAVEVLFGRLAGADKAEGDGAAFSVLFPVGQGSGSDQIFYVLAVKLSAPFRRRRAQ
jgi:hypothetical protein